VVHKTYPCQQHAFEKECTPEQECSGIDPDKEEEVVHNRHPQPKERKNKRYQATRPGLLPKQQDKAYEGQRLEKDLRWPDSCIVVGKDLEELRDREWQSHNNSGVPGRLLNAGHTRTRLALREGAGVSIADATFGLAANRTVTNQPYQDDEEPGEHPVDAEFESGAAVGG